MKKCPFCGEEISIEATTCPSCNRELPAETVALEMPLCYTHLCEACDARMTVYDHAYWKELACESCGETFIGDPTKAAPLEEETGPGRRRVLWIAGIVIVVVAAAVAAFLLFS